MSATVQRMCEHDPCRGRACLIEISQAEGKQHGNGCYQPYMDEDEDVMHQVHKSAWHRCTTILTVADGMEIRSQVHAQERGHVEIINTKKFASRHCKCSGWAAGTDVDARAQLGECERR